MREIKGETMAERLVRVEQQRIKDVELNALEHKQILEKINAVLALMNNHLSHHRKAFWALVALFGAEILRELVPQIVHILQMHPMP
jgi:hypothetical protein